MKHFIVYYEVSTEYGLGYVHGTVEAKSVEDVPKILLERDPEFHQLLAVNEVEGSKDVEI